MASSIGAERADRLAEAMQPILIQAELLQGDVAYRQPAPAEWSAMQILAHVAEFVPYWASQAEAVARRQINDQPFGRRPDDPSRIEPIQRHAQDSVDEIVGRLRLGLDEAQALLRTIPDDGWRRTAHHLTRGEMSVETFVEQFLFDHLAEHSGQLRQATSTSP
jgi:DinB superfamily